LGAAPQRQETTVIDNLTGRLDGRTILVVDDQPEVLAVLTAFLEAAGAEVAPATDPADVVEALRDDPGAWDLLVTDFDMPGMTGAELADAARRLVPGLPVILVTALAGVAGRHGSAFAAVLGKPVDRDALVSSAEAAILRSRPKE
jgi:CheY-like chemotaxis protein